MSLLTLVARRVRAKWLSKIFQSSDQKKPFTGIGVVGPMFLVLLVVAAVFVAVMVYLPYSANLIKYEKNQKNRNENHDSTKASENLKTQQQYVPPDEVGVSESKAKSSGLKNITSDDIPIKLRLNQPHQRRRAHKLDVDRNPNNYDYDLDEMINGLDSENEDETRHSSSEQYSGFSKDVV